MEDFRHLEYHLFHYVIFLIKLIVQINSRLYNRIQKEGKHILAKSWCKVIENKGK